MKNIIKNAMILTVITLVSGLLLGFVYDITKEPIAQAKEKAKNEAYQTVMQEVRFGKQQCLQVQRSLITS